MVWYVKKSKAVDKDGNSEENEDENEQIELRQILNT